MTNDWVALVQSQKTGTNDLASTPAIVFSLGSSSGWWALRSRYPLELPSYRGPPWGQEESWPETEQTALMEMSVSVTCHVDDSNEDTFTEAQPGQGALVHPFLGAL
jgi:hypothetical protein